MHWFRADRCCARAFVLCVVLVYACRCCTASAQGMAGHRCKLGLEAYVLDVQDLGLEGTCPAIFRVEQGVDVGLGLSAGGISSLGAPGQQFEFGHRVPLGANVGDALGLRPQVQLVLAVPTPDGQLAGARVVAAERSPMQDHPDLRNWTLQQVPMSSAVVALVRCLLLT